MFIIMIAPADGGRESKVMSLQGFMADGLRLHRPTPPCRTLEDKPGGRRIENL
jgi:hypothetical protein